MDNYSESDFILTPANSIYNVQQKVEVYLVNLRNENLVVKKVYFKTADEGNTLLKETFAMCSLDHSSIVKVRTGLLGQSMNYLLMIMDYYPDGDLDKEIRKRASQQAFWHEDQLLTIFQKLVSGFIYMQKKDVVHRDIKPQNILKKGEDYFIADLGCAFKSKRGESDSLAGTPAYLSPKLAEAYKLYYEKKDLSGFNHNAYKSDVFSLGVTFLYMATLRSIGDQNSMSRNNFEYARNQMIGSCRYSERIKNILSIMLEYDEDNRPDFILLGNSLPESGVQNNVKSNNVANGNPASSKYVNMNLRPSRAVGNNHSVPNIPANANQNNSFTPNMHQNANTHFIAEIEKCYYCDQPLGNATNNIQLKIYKFHFDCFPYSYVVQTKGNAVNQIIVKLNQNALLLDSKILENCNCGNISYFKPYIHTNYCLNCIRTWGFDTANSKPQQDFYKILSLYCSEVNIYQNINQVCICYEKSVEVILNAKHYLCYSCLEKCLWSSFNGQVINCSWGCCTNLHVPQANPAPLNSPNSIKNQNNISALNEPLPVQHEKLNIVEENKINNKSYEKKKNNSFTNSELPQHIQNIDQVVPPNTSTSKPNQYTPPKLPEAEFIALPEKYNSVKITA